MVTQRLVFHGLESALWVTALLLVLIASIVCVALLFRYERQLIARKLGNTLLALRLAVLAVLGIILLEPVLAWTLDLEKSGRIVVAVDVSQSMETKDEQATKSEKLLTAQALGLLSGESPVEAWGKAWDAGREPDWATATEEPDPQKRLALSDARREMAQGAINEVIKLERLEIARRILQSGPKPLLKDLSQLGQVELCLFAGQSTQLDPETLEQPLEPPGDAIQWTRTDLMQVMNASPAERGGLKLAGVVLLTDGRDNAHTGDSEYLKRFAGGAPIHPVLIGSEKRPKELAIASLDYPPTVFQNDKPILKASIRTVGLDPGQEVGVSLEKIDADGNAIGDPIRKTIRPTEGSHELQFDLAAETEGRQRYRIKADNLQEEVRSDNNSREFALQVVDDRSEVLLIDGEGRWEFRYLHAALSRDERVQLSAVVFNQPYMGVLPDTFFPRELSQKGLNAQSKSTPFEQFDLVIVGDVSPRNMTQEIWTELDRYVREEAGTVILTAGRNDFPLSFNNPVIEGLLPIEKARAMEPNDAAQRRRPQERGLKLALTPDGERQTMLQFHTDPDENRKIWADLPGHPWAIVGEAKPGASVWSALKSQAPDPGLDWERKNAIIVQQYLGTGQVVWIGFDSTWRWRFRVGDSYHHRFWGQFSHWASEFKASAGNEFVRLGLEKPVINEGDDAVLIVRWDPRFLERSPQLKARAVIRPGGPDSQQPGVTVELRPDPERPLVHTGRGVGLRAGEYTVKLEAEGADFAGTTIATDLSVLEKPSLELSDLSANRPLLEKLAQTTGGTFYPIHRAHEVTEKFQQVKETTTQRQEIALWNHWLIFLVFCGLLMAEWVLRKLNGLP